MRSRTEMVTTTFVDSEEDYSDEDDSEEDWRPSASNKNGKKVKQQKGGGAGQYKKGGKRKYSSIKGNKNSKRKATYDNSEEDEIDEPSEDDYDCDDYESISGSSKNIKASLPPKKQFSDKNVYTSKNDDKTGELLNLLVYLKDLTGTDLKKNNQLCLWRKDKNNLLQKYIRVKTTSEEFIFTSSSVYSSFDDKRISDFCDIKVKSIDTSNRRVKIINPSDLQAILLKNHNENSSDDENLSDEKSFTKNKDVRKKINKDALKKKHKTVPKYNDEDYDEEEVEEENDEEEDDCDLEGDDDEDIEEDDESDNDDD